MNSDHNSFEVAPKSSHYDLIVIGSGPGGQRAAVQAAKLGKSVLVVEKKRLGGSCLHLGTIPSKALREAALACEPGTNSLGQVMARTRRVIEEECLTIEEHFDRNQIEFISGIGSFKADAGAFKGSQIEIVNGLGRFVVSSDFVVIAVGTRPRRPSDLDFDGEVLFDSDSILDLDVQPRNLLVLGAGVIGCEYASIFSRMGVNVTLVEARASLLPTIDQEIISALLKQFEKSGINVRLNTKFEGLHKVKAEGGRSRASVVLKDPDREACEFFDAVLYCLGRSGNFEPLNLHAIGLHADERGLLKVNKNYQTVLSNVYAVGDIIGSPALAASSSEQGRLAALHAFKGKKAEFPDTFPYGIYTIPEISTVGFQEAQLKEKGVKYIVGKAHYSALARGKMIGDEHGFLKLLVHAKTHQVIGVHVIGTSATELVHIGQVAVSFGATVEFFVENVFNYPTLAEAYKVAAHNALNQL